MEMKVIAANFHFLRKTFERKIEKNILARSMQPIILFVHTGIEFPSKYSSWTEMPTVNVENIFILKAISQTYLARCYEQTY